MNPLASRRLALFAVLVALAACGHDATAPKPKPPAGAALLIGYGTPGVTLVADTGSATSHIDFGAAFDGAAFSEQGDSVATTSSAFGGDMLFVTDLRAGTKWTVQLPHQSNPGGAAFASGGRYVVALRDSAAVAVVNDPASASPLAYSLLRDAGTCPYDAAMVGTDVWVLDADVDCAGGSYAVLGPSRLIRIPLAGGARDTIVLDTGSVAPLRLFVRGNSAFVFSSGVADYGTLTITRPAAVAKVSLATRSVVTTRLVPGYGVAMRLADDGRLYATVTASIADYLPRAFAMDTVALAPTSGEAFAGPIPLLLADSSVARCDAATADAEHHVWCVEVGIATSKLHVFDAAFRETRTITVDGLAFDLALRP